MDHSLPLLCDEKHTFQFCARHKILMQKAINITVFVNVIECNLIDIIEVSEELSVNHRDVGSRYCSFTRNTDTYKSRAYTASD